MFFDPLYLLFALPGLALSLWAQFKVKSTFQKYSDVPARSGMTGARAAAELIRQRGVSGVRIEPTHGFLSDHYDPFHRVLRLSEDVYHGHSLAALGVAAHEAGHAIQHAQSYGPLKFRSLLVKPASIGSNFGVILASIGLALQAGSLTMVGIVTPAEAPGAAALLKAAALTYVAAAITAILQLLYFLMRAGLLGGRREQE